MTIRDPSDDDLGPLGVITMSAREAAVRRELAAAKETIMVLHKTAGGYEERIVALEAERDQLADELETLETDVDEYLPRYFLDNHEIDPDEANTRERIEFAGDEIKQLTAKLTRAHQALGETGESLAKYGCHLPHEGFRERCPSPRGCICGLDDAVDAALAAVREELADERQSPDLDLLRKFANGIGGRRTGDLIRRGWIKVEVTEAGRAALGKDES